MLKLLVLIGTFFTSIAGYAAASITRKAVVVLSVITAFVAVTTVFLLSMQIIGIM